MLSNRTVSGTIGRDILSLAIRDLDMIQMAMVVMMDEATEKRDKP